MFIFIGKFKKARSFVMIMDALDGKIQMKSGFAPSFFIPLGFTADQAQKGDRVMETKDRRKLTVFAALTGDQCALTNIRIEEANGV